VLDLRQAYGFLSTARLIAADPGDPPVALAGVSTDTRTLRAGELFVALRGELHDAHDHLGRALAAGAAALLVERWTPQCTPPALLVPDSRRALGEIAAGWRRRFALPVIAVAGSNGKTTVKEMVAAILAAWVGADARLATRGNLNNDVGVPLSVLGLRAGHRAAVFELGMNRPGEIAWLASIARPTVALVNNAQREHQEFMHTVAATAHENGEAIAALPPEGVAVFPGDDAQHAPIWRALAGARRTLRFGLSTECAVHASLDARPDGFDAWLDGTSVRIALAIDGAHNVRNALAAAACGLAAGAPAEAIVRGLEAFRPAAGRMRRLACAGGATLFDDSYNANPDSVRAAIDVLAARPSPKVLVLGDMAEVGRDGPRFHAEVGDYARDRGIDLLITFGPASREAARAFGAGAEPFDAIEPLLERVRGVDAPGTSVLVKGSRSMRTERVVQALAGATVGAGGH
jgi:UDP-N-acetylmuramoyl-tripeptide--D-alanyl-D-alanine ligase